MSALNNSRAPAMLWVCGALLAGMSSLALVRCVLGFIPWPEMAAGWIVAMANAAGTYAINRASVGTAGRKFPMKGVFWNILRAFVLLSIIAIACDRLDGKNFSAFLAAMFSGYFVFLILEILRLYKSGTKGPEGNERSVG